MKKFFQTNPEIKNLLAKARFVISYKPENFTYKACSSQTAVTPIQKPSALMIGRSDNFEMRKETEQSKGQRVIDAIDY